LVVRQTRSTIIGGQLAPGLRVPLWLSEMQQNRSGRSGLYSGGGVDKVGENPESDLRDGARASFAKFRTSLALDRTTLAWVRTTLTFATFGFGMIGFFRAVRQATQSEQAVRLHRAAIHMGVALVVIGMVATILASFSHWMALRRLRSGEQLVISQWPLTIIIAALISVLGLYALWSVFAQ
jgi:inner membrane protein YidH